jgi:hypothetical protein
MVKIKHIQIQGGPQNEAAVAPFLFDRAQGTHVAIEAALERSLKSYRYDF